MNIEQTNLGFEIKTPHHTLLMGGKLANFENIKAAYPSIEFTRIKQIHSDVIVESENSVLDYQQIADAHYTRAANLGLCISSADCIPLFMIHPATDLIVGIHAGWRGVANRIISKSIARMHALGAPNQEVHVIIGPHIQKSSFEVSFDVRDTILSSIGHAAAGTNDMYYENISAEKALVDLNQIAKEQLIQAGIPFDNVYGLQLDTFSNLDFHSHRRDKEKAGRQLSFICRNV